MEVIKIKMRAIDIKKPLTFSYYTNIEIAKEKVEEYIKENFQNFSMSERSHEGNLSYHYKIDDYKDSQGNIIPYYINFSFKKIFVCEG